MSTLNINGETREVVGQDEMNLLDWLRDEAHLTAAKNGCAQGACGACMILVDGRASRACLLTVAKAAGKKIVTLEGFTEYERDVFAWAFAEAGAVQCGFCIPGMVVSAKGLLDVNPSPTRAEIKEALRGNVCRCTGYQKIEEAIEKAAKMFRDGGLPPRMEDRVWHLGERMPRLDAAAKTRGSGIYVDDMTLPGMLYGSALRAPTPRAYIRAIDASRARALPGVVVLTAADVPGERYLGHLKHDWPVMIAAGEETRYIGDAIALVAAESKAAVREALSLIRVDYEERKPILTVEEALAEGAPQLHPDGNRLAVGATVKRGDVDAALAASAHVIREKFHTPPVEHAFLEPESALAFYEGAVLTVYTADQGIYDDLHGITAMLGLSNEEVRVISKLVGGGFGGKEDLSVQHHAALLSWHTKKPVRVTMNRDDSIRTHPKRHAMDMEYRLGADEDGRITAMRIRISADTGAYASLGGPVLQRACTHATGPYRVPAVDIEGIGAFTNNPPGGAFRGFGVTQSAFAVEQMMNLLAEATGLSYWEIRDRNVVEPGDVLGNGQIAEADVGIKEALAAVKQAFESSPRAGIACGIKNSGLGVGVPDIGRVRVEIRGGKLCIFTSAACMGQGIATTLVQIASHTTNLPISQIEIADPDTFLTPNTGTTTASRQTLFTGEALRLCCQDFLAELAESGSLAVLEGRQYYREFSSPTDPMGSDKANPRSHVAYSFAAHVCILDEEGRVERFVACHDVGSAVNPVNVEGQIEGGVVMGLGYALTEDLRLMGGVPQSKFGSLGLWRAPAVPPIETIILEREKARLGEFAYGAKGVGEIVLIPPAPAIALAYRRWNGKFQTSLPLEGTPYRK